MALVVATAAASLPVSRTEAKAHCRVDISIDDTAIDDLIKAATEAVQIRTGRQLINATFRASWRNWPRESKFRLIREPLVSVSHVKYYDDTETLQTLSSSLYYVDSDSTPPCVEMKPGAAIPSLYYERPGLIQVTFVAGYGSDATDVPAPLKHAIKLLVAHWYENHEGHVVNGYARELPDGIKALCDSYKVAWIKG
jgi:uncharacterized phiE125 gp8 family phage protein